MTEYWYVNCKSAYKQIDPIMSSSGNRMQKNLFRPLSNLGSGLMLKVFKPFNKGDFIEIDGQLGSVIKRGAQKTTLKSVNGAEFTIENIEFYKKHLHNLSSKNIISLELIVEISYKSNMSKVKEEILTFLIQNNRILSTPTPKIQVSKIKNKSIELTVKPWCLLDDFLELDCTLENLLTQYLFSKNIGAEQDEVLYSDSKMLA